MVRPACAADETRWERVLAGVRPMTDEDSPPPKKDLDARLRALRERTRRGGNGGPAPGATAQTAMGFALRVGVELVAGLVIGGGIGWFLDRWFGTSPFLLLLFFFLGAAAGIVSVFRTARELQRQGPRDDG